MCWILELSSSTGIPATCWTAVCGRSATARGDIGFRIVVVDNASADGSAAMVERKYPQADLIASPENVGYPRGNNIGLRALGYRGVRDVDRTAPRYALLLNPDTELPPKALLQMIQFMDSRPDFGVAGPKLVLTDGSLDKACRRGFSHAAGQLLSLFRVAKRFPRNPRFGRYNMTFVDEDQDIEVDSVRRRLYAGAQRGD